MRKYITVLLCCFLMAVFLIPYLFSFMERFKYHGKRRDFGREKR